MGMDTSGHELEMMLNSCDTSETKGNFKVKAFSTFIRGSARLLRSTGMRYRQVVVQSTVQPVAPSRACQN